MTLMAGLVARVTLKTRNLLSLRSLKVEQLPVLWLVLLQQQLAQQRLQHRAPVWEFNDRIL